MVDRFELPEIKTKGLLAALGALKVTTPREGTRSAKALVVDAAAFWAHLGEIRAVGASGIVSLTPDALLR